MENTTLLGKTTVQNMLSLESEDSTQSLKNLWYYSEFSFEDISAVGTQTVFVYYHLDNEDDEKPHVIIMTTVEGDVLGSEGSSMGFYSDSHKELIEAFTAFMADPAAA